MPAPRIGKFDQSHTYQWSNGDNFNGFAAIALTRPATGAETSTAYKRLVLTGVNPRTWLPVGFSFIPIQNGKLDSNLGLYYNLDINPPGSQYIAYYYDSSKYFVAGPTDPFTVSSATILPEVLPLPVPIGAGTITPIPDASCVDGGDVPDMPCKCGLLVDFEVPSGVVDGVNTIFTFDHVPTPAESLHLYFNGSRLTPGAHYTQSGAEVNMIAPFIPEPGDLFYGDYIWE